MHTNHVEYLAAAGSDKTPRGSPGETSTRPALPKKDGAKHGSFHAQRGEEISNYLPVDKRYRKKGAFEAEKQERNNDMSC